MPRIPIKHIRRKRDNAIPRRTAAPSVSPAARRHDTRQCSVFFLTIPQTGKPHSERFLTIEQKTELFRRKGNIARPARFFTMRTIGRKIVKIGIIAAQRVFKGLIRVLIRTIKIPYTAKSRTLFGKNYKIFRRLRFLDARNFYITPSVITETRHKTFAPLSLADIAYHLNFPIHIPIANPALDIFCIHVSVFEPFPDNKRYNLPRFPVDFQDGNPRRIDAEIVQIPVFERNDANSFSPLIFAYRFEIRQNATAFRSCCGKRFFPSGIVEIGQIPTLDLSSGIVIFSFPIIIVQNGRRGPIHLSGRRKNFFPVHFHAKRRFRRGAELRQMNIPRHAAIVIREPVAENQTYRVFSLF